MTTRVLGSQMWTAVKRSRPGGWNQQAAALGSSPIALNSITRRAMSINADDIHGLPTNEQLSLLNSDVEPVLNDPSAVLEWAKNTFNGRIAMSTSFGIQSAVLLHLATSVMPKIPVVWVDTGYLPPETYHYAETLTEALDLNLRVYSNREWTPARMEAIHGKLWENDDAESHTLYGRMRKVIPMEEGLNAIEPQPLALLSGLRAAQTKARANMSMVNFQNNRFKVLPLLKMSDEDVAEYIDKFDLPAHPLQAKNYVTVGDWHSSRPLEEGEDARNTRFGGKFQECGLHVEAHEPVETPIKLSSPPLPPKIEVAAPPEVEGPPSAIATGIAALESTPVTPETDIAVIMIKKVTEDGSYCRKCNDVADKMEADGVTEWVGYTGYADVRDKNSEGAIIAKYFDIATAPFFLVRTRDEISSNAEWRIVRSYLQLRKMLQNAAEKVETKKSKLVEEVTEMPLEETPEYKQAVKEMEDLKERVKRLTEQLHASEAAVESTRRYFVERFADVTNSSALFTEHASFDDLTPRSVSEDARV